jgi:fibronectin type 3 domain-containing protein
MLENFTAFYYQGGIQLLWNPSPAADLAGYRVYRHDNVTGIDQLYVTLVPSQHELYDAHIVSGRTYHYWVTAFDQSDRKNESVPTPRLPVTVH